MSGNKPGVVGYFAGTGIIIIGIVICAGLIASGIKSATESGTRFVVPGEHTLVFDQPGWYMIYHEYRSALNGKIYDTQGQVSGLECHLKNKASNEELSLEPAGSSTTYSIGGAEGVGMFSVSIPTPGEYVFSAAYPEGVSGVEAVLATGRGGGKIVISVLSGLFALFACFAVGATLAIVTFVRRVRGENQRAATLPPEPGA